MCVTLQNPMYRLLKTTAVENKHGRELSAVKSKDTYNQFSDRNLVIGEAARKYLDKVQPE